MEYSLWITGFAAAAHSTIEGLLNCSSGENVALNLIKLCVGAPDVEHLEDWIADCKKGRDTLDHVTRMFPRRKDQILPGGSLYWVIKGLILCRQPLADLEAVRGDDGIERCRIVFKPHVIRVRPTPRRAFQGWRYLEEPDCPPDLKKGDIAIADMPPKMRKELADLGLI
jgi:hypothetical protein